VDDAREGSDSEHRGQGVGREDGGVGEQAAGCDGDEGEEHAFGAADFEDAGAAVEQYGGDGCGEGGEDEGEEVGGEDLVGGADGGVEPQELKDAGADDGEHGLLGGVYGDGVFGGAAGGEVENGDAVLDGDWVEGEAAVLGDGTDGLEANEFVVGHGRGVWVSEGAKEWEGDGDDEQGQRECPVAEALASADALEDMGELHGRPLSRSWGVWGRGRGRI